jgi:hypothetical protein
MNRHSNILASCKDAPSNSLSNDAVTCANIHGHQSILEIKANMNSHSTILARGHPLPETRQDSLPISMPGSYPVSYAVRSGPDDSGGTEVGSEDQDLLKLMVLLKKRTTCHP